MNRNLLKTLVAATSTGLLAFQAAMSLGQQQHSHQSDHSLPIAATGSDAPESIPDDLAYAHFVLALALPERPTLQETLRRDSLLAQVELATDDRAAFVEALKGVREQLDFLAREASRLSGEPPSSTTRLESLRLRRTRLLSETQGRLASRLSEGGRARLDKYIKQQVKPRIVVYGEPLK